jgi:hypothetical protein
VALANPHLRLLAMVICLIASAACDDNDTITSASPTGPTFVNRLSGPPIVGSFSSGAVITGRIIGSDLTRIDQRGGVTAPRVGIAPPGISTVAGRDGSFTLAGVPPGSVTLIVTDNGVSAGILLTNVGLNQLIILDVRVSGGVATIESEQRRIREQATR